jgi:hypothetical protein
MKNEPTSQKIWVVSSKLFFIDNKQASYFKIKEMFQNKRNVESSK